MTVEREVIERSFAALRKCTEENDWEGFSDLFAKDGTFVNSMLAEPIRGRDNIRAATALWPNVVNVPEWVVIEGNRLAMGWNERQESMAPSAAPYRGFSTFEFDEEGRIVAYEGMFDTAAVIAALSAE